MIASPLPVSFFDIMPEIRGRTSAETIQITVIETPLADA